MTFSASATQPDAFELERTEPGCPVECLLQLCRRHHRTKTDFQKSLREKILIGSDRVALETSSTKRVDALNSISRGGDKNNCDGRRRTGFLQQKNDVSATDATHLLFSFSENFTNILAFRVLGLNKNYESCWRLKTLRRL